MSRPTQDMNVRLLRSRVKKQIAKSFHNKELIAWLNSSRINRFISKTCNYAAVHHRSEASYYLENNDYATKGKPGIAILFSFQLFLVACPELGARLLLACDLCLNVEKVLFPNERGLDIADWAPTIDCFEYLASRERTVRWEQRLLCLEIDFGKASRDQEAEKILISRLEEAAESLAAWVGPHNRFWQYFKELVDHHDEPWRNEKIHFVATMQDRSDMLEDTIIRLKAACDIGGKRYARREFQLSRSGLTQDFGALKVSDESTIARKFSEDAASDLDTASRDLSTCSSTISCDDSEASTLCAVDVSASGSKVEEFLSIQYDQAPDNTSTDCICPDATTVQVTHSEKILLYSVLGCSVWFSLPASLQHVSCLVAFGLLVNWKRANTMTSSNLQVCA